MIDRKIGAVALAVVLSGGLVSGCSWDKNAKLAADRAEQAASRAEDASRRVEAAAGRAEAAANRAVAAAEEAEARMSKGWRK